MAHHIVKLLQNANFVFKLYASSFIVQPYASLRFVVFARISSFFKSFWKEIFFFVLLFSSLSLASAGDLPTPEKLGLPFESAGEATTPIVKIIKESIKYVGLLAILALSWGGLQFLTSMGNDEKVKHAKHTIIYALVGVILSVIAYAIIDIVNSLRI